MVYKKQKTTWVKTLKPDDMSFTMLTAAAYDKNYWPNEFNDDSLIFDFVQIVNNPAMSQNKTWTTESGVSKSKIVTKYISFRILIPRNEVNAYTEKIKNWAKHSNCINYNYNYIHNYDGKYDKGKPQPSVSIRYELTDDILDMLQ